MENTNEFIFLKKTDYSGEPIVYYAIPKDKIETLNVSDTYNFYGRRIDPSDAGDSLELLTEKAVKIANDAYNEYHNNNSDEYVNHWSVGDPIYAYNYSCEGYNAVIQSKELKEDDDYKTFKETCKGFNYWNGNNWKTIVVESNNDPTDYEILNDKELTALLNKAIENKGFFRNGSGCKNYFYEDEDNKYMITESFWQGSWETYSIKPE